MPTTCFAPAFPPDSHGRKLTTTPEAASCYRTAQRHCRDVSRLIGNLQNTSRADPHFAVAAVDLLVLGGEPASAPASTGPSSPSLSGSANSSSPTDAPLRLPETRPPRHAWERHHIEVVLAAGRGDACRAVDLLREHLTVVTCDPIAVAIVLGAADQEPIDDILARLPGCHYSPDEAQPRQ
jgi:hypothetical protein